MSMNLTPDGLRKIADTIEAIEKADLDVVTVKVAGHTVGLQRRKTGAEGEHKKGTLMAVGIGLGNTINPAR